MKNIKYLNDKVAKKALAKENKNIRNYVAKVISDVTKLPYSDLKDNLELVYPEVSYNKDVVNSEVDIAFKNDYLYFNIEINYSRSKVSEVKGLVYLYQLSLRQVKNQEDYKDMKKVIQICINSYDYYEKGDFIYHIAMEELKYHLPYEGMQEVYLINLSYFKNIEYTEIKKEELLKELAIFVIEDEKFLNELYKGDEVMAELKKELTCFMEEIDGVLYYNEEKLQQAIENEMTEKGRKEGAKEQAIETAKKMLAKNKSIEEIQEFTDLSVEEIEKLKD